MYTALWTENRGQIHYTRNLVRRRKKIIELITEYNFNSGSRITQAIRDNSKVLDSNQLKQQLNRIMKATHGREIIWQRRPKSNSERSNGKRPYEPI